MTVQFETPFIRYKGNNLSTVFTFSWSFDDVSEILVEINGVLQIEGTTYELENYTLENGGEIRTTLTNPLTSDDDLLIYRKTPITQEVDYEAFDAFPSETHEGQMDKDTRILQELIDGGRGVAGGPVDLESIEKPEEVEIDNTGGEDAHIPVWDCSNTLAGVYHGEVTESAPMDGDPDTHADGYMYWEITV